MRARAFLALLLAVSFGGCNSSSRQLLEQAEARWRDGQYEDAIRLNTLLYERDPRGRYAAGALLNLGNIEYLNQRRIRNAIDWYRKAAAEFPGTPEERTARSQLAAIYSDELHDLTLAIAEYDRLLGAGGELENRQEIEVRRANAYFAIGDLDRAQRELQRIEEAGITGELGDQVRLKIGNIYQMRKKYDEAADYFGKVSGALCLECRRRAIIHLAETYEALYDLDKAVATLKTLDRTPENIRHVDHEIARLNQKRRNLNTGADMNWQKSAHKE